MLQRDEPQRHYAKGKQQDTKLCTAGFHLYEIPKIYEPTETNQMVHARRMRKMRWELTV